MRLRYKLLLKKEKEITFQNPNRLHQVFAIAVLGAWESAALSCGRFSTGKEQELKARLEPAEDDAVPVLLKFPIAQEEEGRSRCCRNFVSQR